MADIILGRVRPVFTGDWDEERAYVLLDRFLYNNTLYECVKDAPAGTAVENTEYYVIVIEQGPTGPQGPPPAHKWTGTTLYMENADGTYDDGTDLRGPQPPLSDSVSSTDTTIAASSLAVKTVNDRVTTNETGLESVNQYLAKYSEDIENIANIETKVTDGDNELAAQIQQMRINTGSVQSSLQSSIDGVSTIANTNTASIGTLKSRVTNNETEIAKRTLRLTKNTTFYIGLNGKDDETPGRGLSSSMPFATLQYAWDWYHSHYAQSKFEVSFHLTAGTYNWNTDIMFYCAYGNYYIEGDGADKTIIKGNGSSGGKFTLYFVECICFRNITLDLGTRASDVIYAWKSGLDFNGTVKVCRGYTSTSYASIIQLRNTSCRVAGTFTVVNNSTSTYPNEGTVFAVYQESMLEFVSNVSLNIGSAYRIVSIAHSMVNCDNNMTITGSWIQGYYAQYGAVVCSGYRLSNNATNKSNATGNSCVYNDPTKLSLSSGAVHCGSGITTTTADEEYYRYLWLGIPRPWRSTKLPANHVVPDGSFVKFANWPDLKTAWDSGWFYGMTLAYNASASDKSAFLGKWRPDAATPTGLYLPNMINRFFKYGTTTNTTWLGKIANSGAPNILGNDAGSISAYVYAYTESAKAGLWGGALGINAASNTEYTSVTGWTTNINARRPYLLEFNASKSNSIYGSNGEIMPQTVHLPLIIYLGRYQS